MGTGIRGVIATLAGAIAIAATAAGGAWAQDDELPDGAGKTEAVDACTQCHTAGVITAQRRTPDQWSEIVARMIGLGASLSDRQQRTILAYLNARLGKQGAIAPKPAPAQAGPP